MAVPRVANEYVAFRIVMPSPGFGEYYDVNYDLLSANNLQIKALNYSLSSLVNIASHFPAVPAMFANFNEFRIRSMKLQLLPFTLDSVGQSNGHHPTNGVNEDYRKPSVPCYIWYPSQHYNLNPAQEFSTYTELMESGERFTKCTMDQDKSITVSWVPQVVDSSPQAGLQPPDIQMPWVETSQWTIDNVVTYGPQLVWKKPMWVQQGDAGTRVACRYQAVLHYVIEFRDSK